MKKLLLPILLTLLTSLAARAQPLYYIDFTGSVAKIVFTDNSKRGIPGYAQLECTYDFGYVRDTLAGNVRPANTTMKLLIGKNVSRFCSPMMMLVDSVAHNNIREAEMDQRMAMSMPFTDMSQVYKKHSEKKLLFTDLLIDTHFIYEEPLEVQEWTILDEYREILGYECQRAECDFRGRKYIAWFTAEIPISEGPWKFFGLPGLILSVADDKGHYRYEMTGIETVDDKPILFARRDYMKTDRRTYLAALRRYREDPFLFSGSERSEPGRIRPDIQYDLMERDYR